MASYEKKKLEKEFVNAAYNGKMNIVEECIQRNVDMEAHYKHGNVHGMAWTALSAACEYGHFHVIRYLIEQCHANVHAKDKAGITALHLACTNGHVNVIRYLVHEPIDYALAMMQQQNSGFDPSPSATFGSRTVFD